MIRGRDGVTKFFLSIKERETRLTIREYDDVDDDYDDDDNPRKRWMEQLHLEHKRKGNTANISGI